MSEAGTSVVSRRYFAPTVALDVEMVRAKKKKPFAIERLFLCA